MKNRIVTIPNILTLLRIALIPVAVIFIYQDKQSFFTLTIIVLILAVFTDILDGQIARRTNQVTNIGKLLDPVADKLMVVSVMIAMTDINMIAGWIVIIVVARELLATGIRAIAADSGVVISANWWGKFKTGFQFAALIILLMGKRELGTLVLYIAVILAVFSVIIYLINYFNVINKI
ncbi:MAG: CDP-diacylglycerol--glycerol-3-phosphate 3-phosphatidyltransferase [Epsilonproteobacteria bacterium]|nr:CDP-diacylglycerol--glycerol-3-phosphate 3-phosphatidyltransferase [Campylobacterota bacterium]